MNNIKLGNKVRDVITGYTGIATNRTEFMNGNVQYTILPPVEDGKPYPEGVSLDYHTLEVVDEGFASRVTEPTYKSDVVLGNVVECLVSGAKGIATHKVTYMNGCSAFLVVEKCENRQTGMRNNYEDWVDQTRVKVVSEGIVQQNIKNPVNAEGKVPGGAPMRGIPRG